MRSCRAHLNRREALPESLGQRTLTDWHELMERVGPDALTLGLPLISPAQAQALLLEMRIPHQVTLEGFKAWWARASEEEWSQDHITAWRSRIRGVLDDETAAPFVQWIIQQLPSVMPNVGQHAHVSGQHAYVWLAAAAQSGTFGTYWPVFRNHLNALNVSTRHLDLVWPFAAMISGYADHLNQPEVWEWLRDHVAPENIGKTVFAAVLKKDLHVLKHMADWDYPPFDWVAWMEETQQLGAASAWMALELDWAKVDSVGEADWLVDQGWVGLHEKWTAAVTQSLDHLPETRARRRKATLTTDHSARQTAKRLRS